jgi:pyruvate dehydrogenase phosphatase
LRVVVITVLGERRADGTWNVDVLSSYHNGEDPDEAARVVREHPGEEDCIQDERVLGAIAITRGMSSHATNHWPALSIYLLLFSCSPG